MSVDDHHSAKIEVKGIESDQLPIVETHAEAIALATGAEIDLLSTIEEAETNV